jgi:hypothetical protein
MKLILVLSLLWRCFQLGNAETSLNSDELASQLYQKATAKIAFFFDTAGTPLVDFVRPSLRTASNSAIHDHATAHFTYYKDKFCTQPDYILDMKINRCADYLGNIKPTIVQQNASKWTISFEPFDPSCTNSIGAPTYEEFEKNVCTPVGSDYVTFNLIAHPLKSVPGGGDAFVFYDNDYDCQISTHVNLGRAQLMYTFLIDVCTVGFYGNMKATSCTSGAFDLLQFYVYSKEGCDPGTLEAINNIGGNGCFHVSPSIPYRILCIADSGPVPTFVPSVFATNAPDATGAPYGK